MSDAVRSRPFLDHSEAASKLARSGPPRMHGEPRGHSVSATSPNHWACRGCDFVTRSLSDVSWHVITNQHEPRRP